MRASIEQDRLAQLLLGANSRLDYDEGRLRLERAALTISADAAAGTAWGQAALLTAAECGVRMFRGGVYLARDFVEPVIVGCRRPGLLRSELLKIGCRREAAPPHAVTLHVGCDAPPAAKVLHAWADGWVATVSQRPPAQPIVTGNEISGATAAAMAVSEAFRGEVMNDLRAGKRTQRLSPLRRPGRRPQG